MIIEYLRPKTIPEALAQLARQEPVSYPLGGGTYLNRPREAQYAVVDLQALELGDITRKGNSIHVGATATLQSIVEFKGLPEDVYKAAKLEGTYNLRQVATIAGTLVTATGRSPLATVLLCMDASLEILVLDHDAQQTKLGDWLPLREHRQPGMLISKVTLPANVKVAYESIARSPADQAIVCAAVAQWPSGRTRLALGGYGRAPVMAMDGPEADGIVSAAQNAYSHAGDEWASAEYRKEMAGIFASRCLNSLSQQ
jgi:putative selenate reductase FAD-binding subunit